MDWWFFPYVLTAIQLFGFWITGRYPRAGWLYMVLTGIPWAIYGMVSQQDGWLICNLLFVGVYFRNWHIQYRRSQISQ